MEIAFLIIGIVVGGVIGFLISRSQKPKSEVDTSAFEKKISVLETESIYLKKEKEEQKKEIEKQRADLLAGFLAEKEEQRKDLEKQRAELQIEFRTERDRLLNELKEEQKKYFDASNALEKSRTFFKAQEEKIIEQKKEISEMQMKLKTEFENIANKILDEKSEKFTKQNKDNLDVILNPFKEKIQAFEKKVEETYDKEKRDKDDLRVEVKKLFELNSKISIEAENLTKALKGDVKKQGNWGEMILEKILERSGLVKDHEYRKQFHTTNADGSVIQPDFVVMLPDNKHIIIDSKVSLVAYEAYTHAEDETIRQNLLKQHIDSVKAHIKGLGDKSYHSGKEFDTPEFVLMFLPIESSFALAVQADTELFGYAWEKQIVLVSPSTLFATLRTIANIWKQEKQNKNAMEIARLAGSMYDKFVAFVEDLNRIEQRITQTREAYDSAYNKLKGGAGNLVRTSEKIKELGAKANKSLPDSILDKDSNQLSATNE
jgi:DNA recombination protein RmuC